MYCHFLNDFCFPKSELQCMATVLTLYTKGDFKSFISKLRVNISPQRHFRFAAFQSQHSPVYLVVQTQTAL